MLETVPCWKLQQTHLMPGTYQGEESSGALRCCFGNGLRLAGTWHFFGFGITYEEEFIVCEGREALDRLSRQAVAAPGSQEVSRLNGSWSNLG